MYIQKLEFFYIKLSQRLCYPTHLNVSTMQHHQGSQLVQIRPRLQTPHKSTRQSLSLSKTLIQGSKGKNALNREDGQKIPVLNVSAVFGFYVVKEVNFEKHFTKSCWVTLASRVTMWFLTMWRVNVSSLSKTSPTSGLKLRKSEAKA